MSTPLPNLKPMTAGDILDQAIRLYRQNFVGLVTIVGIVTLPIYVIQAIAYAVVFPLTGNFNSPAPLGSNPTLALPVIILSVVLTILLAFFAIFELGAVTSFISERFLGRPITVWQAYKNAFGRGLSLFVAALLLVFAYLGVLSVLLAVVFVPLLVGALSASGGGNQNLGVLAGVGGVLCLCVLFIPTIVGLVYIYTRWTFWTQAIMLENYNSTGALGRSWKLVKGNFWRVLLFNVLLTILISVISFSASSALSISAAFVPSLAFRFIAQSVVTGIISVLIGPLQHATLTILYYDLRIRKEGFDLQMQMQEPTPDLPSLIPGAS